MVKVPHFRPVVLNLFFPLFNLCSCTVANPHNLSPRLEIIWLLLFPFNFFFDAFYCYLAGGKKENVSVSM